MSVTEYNECVKQFSDRVFRFIIKNMKDEDDARDVVQNAFEILWRHVDEVTFEKSRSYLFTVAYHNMIDQIRKQKKLTLLEEHHEEIETPEKGNPDVKSIINHALNKLPGIQKTVVMLRDYEGYEYEEIGRITGLTESQVKVYIFRGRQTLKNYLINIEKVI